MSCLSRCSLLAALLVSSAALAQVEPTAAIYSARTPLNTPISLPYSLLLTPGDGQNTISILNATPPLPAHGTLSFPAVYDGTPAQAFLYTPNTGYAGIDQFYFKITDADGDVGIGLVTLNVGNVPAIAADDNFVIGTEPDTFLDVLFNDFGFADPVSFQIIQQPVNGSINLVLPDPVWQGGIGVFYTPNPGYTGADQFRYQIGDGIDLDSATVTLNASADSDGDDILDLVDNCPATFNPQQTDTDGDTRGDACDNCTLVPNTNQRNTNSDAFGNICDADLNNNGQVNVTDLNLFRAAFGTANADADLNGSGGVNVTDLNIFRGLFGRAPGPAGELPPGP
jgi:hypothetical protein